MNPLRPNDDHYPTPPEATRALLSVESFGGGIWEPCAGSGEMARVLRDSGYGVFASTIGGGSRDVWGDLDFLKAEMAPAGTANIITNPPFKIAEQIVRRAIDLKPVKVAMLLNIKFLASIGRARGLWSEWPPARVWVIADRITMYPAGYVGPKNSTTETHAWFVWDLPQRHAAPVIGWVVAADYRSAAE